MSQKNILLEAFYGLARKINKVGGEQPEFQEGVIGERLPELELNMDEADLIKLSDVWEKDWDDSPVKSQWIKAGDENENYWKGQHFQRPNVNKTRALVDNVIYEGLETYLPQVTRRNPEPIVALAVGEPQSQENQDFAHALQLELGELADDLKMRLKLKGAARHKEIYLLGVAKFGWDLDRDIPAMKILRPQRIILDPNATVDEDGYSGDRIGEKRKLAAWRLVKILQSKNESDPNISYIKDLVKHEMATEVGFIEWWTPEYMFWKLNSRVLVKRKNPHWNYDQEITPEEPVGDQEGDTDIEGNTDEDVEELAEGMPAVPETESEGDEAAVLEPTKQKGINHFAAPRMPYLLLATYTLGKQPVDITSNIGQNLSNQDLVNKRIKQIDLNADNMNQGLIVSLERSGLTAGEAKKVAEALRKGGVVAIPAGAPGDAVMKLPTPGLPADVYNQLVDVRTRIRGIWGVQGSSPAGIANEDTVRGKLIVKSLDTDRIGGGISEYLEQFAGDAYNWLTQLLYVYDERFAGAIANGAPIPKVKVGVKEGSLLPKDSTTIANQAIELAGAGKMSTLDLYKRLDYPNPEELAANAWLEANAPEVLFEGDPRVQQVLEQRRAAEEAAMAAAAQGGGKGPSESINFKDLPPEGKAQMAAQAGIELAPEVAAAHEAAQAIEKKVPALPEAAAVGQ